MTDARRIFGKAPTMRLPGGGAGGADWVAFSPTWTIGGTAYTDPAGGAFGLYRAEKNPDGTYTVDVEVMALVGLTLPTGEWQFDIEPEGHYGLGNFWVGASFMIQQGEGGPQAIGAVALSGNNLQPYCADGSNVDDAHPFTWATNGMGTLWFSLRFQGHA